MSDDILNEAIATGDAQEVSRVLEANPDLKSRLNDPLPGGAFGFCPGTGVWVTVGSGTAPPPTWPAPPLPGVGPPTAGSPDGATACCA